MSVPGPNLDIEVADRYDTDEPLLEPEGIARLIVAEGAAGSATIVSASFDGKKGQHEAYHRHSWNQISPDVEGVDGGGGRDRRRPHHDHDTCARHERGAPTPHSGHCPKYDGDNEGGGQCPEQIGGDAWEIGR